MLVFRNCITYTNCVKMTKMFILISIFCIIELCMGSRQNSYHIDIRDALIHSYNRSALQNPVVDVVPYNATARILINLSGNVMNHYKSVMINAKVYKLVRNVFREFPLPMLDFDVCDELKNNHLGTEDVIAHANLKLCPISPGSYYLKDYIVEENKFPPHLPLGQYQLYLDIHVDDVIFFANATTHADIVKA